MDKDLALQMIQGCSKVRPEKTKGGKRVPKDVADMASKLASEMHSFYVKEKNEEFYNVGETARAIYSQNIWIGNNSQHWVEVRQRYYDFLIKIGLDSEEAMRDWLENPRPIYEEAENAEKSI